MAFVDKVKYLNQLSIIDEFGGRGDADKISKFYIIFRATDENGSEIAVTREEVETAIADKNIIIADYIGEREYTLAVLASNPDKCNFIFDGCSYKNNTNLISVKIGEFKDNASLCVLFKNKDQEIASTCYLSDFPSTFFMRKNNA